ncbi:PREDICTED: protein trunk-like [Nicrophorus vespilloides]|uniref:Protein trunk-like n=1 Tax=Nicrophorus vespilloides TaxID=110193 RepID=A0ABM1MM63_NICVS|nr:PREDICTED: protein trunk-like [Nicrophorus vespilloides]
MEKAEWLSRPTHNLVGAGSNTGQAIPFVSPFGACMSKCYICNVLICKKTPDEVLKQSLDGVFNERYMRTELPNDTFALDMVDGPKRNADPALSFYVDEDYSREIQDVKPDSLLGRFLYGTSKNLVKRNANRKKKWECDKEISWLDLGPDYYPRFLRSMKCFGTCWFSNICKPRSVTVKLLRRKIGDCVVIKRGNKVGMEGLPVELREKWVWEEKNINYCCDCVAPST